ncbi:MAG: hypothetical protein Q7S63_00925 [bacterium]|nr:hypothetical protein [bacterium]
MMLGAVGLVEGEGPPKIGVDGVVEDEEGSPDCRVGDTVKLTKEVIVANPFLSIAFT